MDTTLIRQLMLNVIANIDFIDEIKTNARHAHKNAFSSILYSIFPSFTISQFAENLPLEIQMTGK